MELVSTPANPVPPGASVFAVTAKDGARLRAARWSPGAGGGRGSVLLLQGRSEFIEKYYEAIAELLQRGLDVVAFDWRGQGGSQRLLSNPRKGHVRRFSDYQADLNAVLKQAMAGQAPEPWFALAHSMGGAILIAQSRAGRSPFSRIVTTAPMIDLQGLRLPQLWP